MSANRFFAILTIAAAAGLTSCADRSAGNYSLGNWEKEAKLVAGGSTKTPAHSLPKTEYPFDEEGNYIASWARSGESRFGKAHSTWASIIAVDVEIDEAALAAEIEAKPGH